MSRPPILTLALLAPVLAGALLPASAAAATRRADATAAGDGSPAERGEDPAPLRLKLLAAMDARIDAVAAQSHLQARLMLDEAMPIAFLGMVAEERGGDLLITQIYRESGAERAGLQVGDAVVAFGGEPMTSKELLYSTIRCYRPGDTVDLRVRRDGRESVLRPTLGQRWEEDEEDVEQYADLPAAKWEARGLPARLDLAGVAPGTRPPGLEQVLGGVGVAPGYVVQRADDAAVLRQAAPDKTGLHFPMALLRGVDADDVVGRVRFRLVAGAQDRTAGIVLHCRDEANYLVARANAVEGDMRIFRTVNGLRRTLPGAVAQIAIDDDRWHTLEFRAEGPKFTAVLDDAVTISSYDTFFPHGRVGLWTKADAVTDFADVSFTAPGS